MIANLDELKDELLNDIKAFIEKKNDGEYLTMPEAAKFMRLSPSSMQKLSAGRKIPVFKPRGGKVYFKKEDLKNYIESGKLRSKKELAKDIKNLKGGDNEE